MDQSLIAWMINGGERSETREDRRQRAHRIALREAAAKPSRERALVGGLFAPRATSTTTPTLTTDCCVA